MITLTDTLFQQVIVDFVGTPGSLTPHGLSCSGDVELPLPRSNCQGAAMNAIHRHLGVKLIRPSHVSMGSIASLG